MKQKKFVACIDPDLHRSGLAIYNNGTKQWLFHDSVPNGHLLTTVQQYCPVEDCHVYVEAGWLNKKSNFRGGSYNVAQAKARNVGENAGAGKFIIASLEAAGYTVFPIKPLEKGFLKSIKGSWTVAGREYIRKATGIKDRINDDARDAIFMCDYFRNGHFYIPPPPKQKRKRNVDPRKIKSDTQAKRPNSAASGKPAGKRRL